MMYRKGVRAERELIRLLESFGYLCLRAAGSGKHKTSPDVLAFKKGMAFAFEVKNVRGETVFIDSKQAEILERWAKETILSCYVVVKKKSQFFAFPVENLERTKGGGFKVKLGKTIGYNLVEIL